MQQKCHLMLKKTPQILCLLLLKVYWMLTNAQATGWLTFNWCMGVILFLAILKRKASVKYARTIRAEKGLYFINSWNSPPIINHQKNPTVKCSWMSVDIISDIYIFLVILALINHCKSISHFWIGRLISYVYIHMKYILFISCRL